LPEVQAYLDPVEDAYVHDDVVCAAERNVINDYHTLPRRLMVRFYVHMAVLRVGRREYDHRKNC